MPGLTSSKRSCKLMVLKPKLRIRDGLTDRSPEAMSKAYVYAFLAFLSSSLKAVSDLLHLWHGRRATVRIRSELTAAIYDKALRRKDASGVITAKEEEGADGEKKEKKSNADTGKVVNLMAGKLINSAHGIIELTVGDTNRIANTIAGAYYIYGSPFEIIVASVFLYK